MNTNMAPCYTHTFIIKKSRIKLIVLILIFGLYYIYIKTRLEPKVYSDPLTSSSWKTTVLFSQRKLKQEKLCGKSVGNNNTIIRRDWDFNLFKRPDFLKNFKNPCFYRNISTENDKSPKLRLQCLPYFLIAGFPKAGTTDLFTRLLNHPDVALVHIKEPRFFNIGRYMEGNFQNATEKYIAFFDKSAAELQRRVAPLECHPHPFPYHHAITGEATVDTVFDNRFWPMVPGNEHCSEPIVTNADYVHHINPDIKVIFMVRNPIERLYSDYIYEARFLHYPVSPHLFHEAVVEAINNHTECRKYASIRACAYNSSIETYKVRLRVGMYHIFISDWLEVFPSENILVVKSEDTNGSLIFQTYKRILAFLNIRPFTKLEEVTVFHRGPINTRAKPEIDLGDMLPETRALVKQFYEKFNSDLAEMFPDINYNS